MDVEDGMRDIIRDGQVREGGRSVGREALLYRDR